jgi:hypothetical protein
MTEEEPTTMELRQLTQCMLWEDPGRANAKFSEIFDELACYEDSSHLSRSLYKCKECGQLYFFEWMEWVDWEGGDDRQYSTLFPVQTQEEIEAMKQASFFDLMNYYPRLHVDGNPKWNGKDKERRHSEG